MKTSTSITILAALAGLAVSGTAASAMSGFDRGSSVGLGLIEPARIVCEPFGRCFRIDPFGRRIFVPRPLGFGRPGVVVGPEVVRPGFVRPGVRVEPGFGVREGRDRDGGERGFGNGRGRGDEDGMQRQGGGQRQQQDGMRQRQQGQDGMQQGQGGGQRRQQQGGMQQGQGGGQRQQQDGMQQRQGQGQGQNGQRRQRPQQQDDGQ